jgi:hypothetical protein
MNLISGICFIAGGFFCLIGSIIGVVADDVDTFQTAFGVILFGFVGITAGGVFHMLKK